MPEPIVLSCSKDHGIIPQEDLFKKRLASEDTSNYKFVHPGNFVYDPNLLWSGAVARSSLSESGIVSPVYVIFEENDSCDGRWLLSWLSSPIRLSSYRAISMGTNVRRRRANFSDLCKLPIPLPPLPEQRAIANILDSIDQTIEATDALVSATEQLRDSLLHNLLTRGLPGRHTQWKQVPGLGPIPANWNVAKLGDIAGVAFSSVDKKTIEGEEVVKLCNYTDVFYNRRIKPDMAFMSATATPIERDQWNLQKGDVLFTKDSETPDEIGIPAYVTETMEEVLCGYHLGVARSKAELIDGAFLSELMASPMLSRQFARVANGVTRFGLTLKATNSLNVPVPPLPEQQAISALFESVDEAIEKSRLDREGLQKLKESASDALLTGRVRTVSK